MLLRKISRPALETAGDYVGEAGTPPAREGPAFAAGPKEVLRFQRRPPHHLFATPFTGVVTIAASYGAGGSLVGPALAKRLRVPFYDRVLPARVAERLAVPLEDILPHDWEGSTWQIEPWHRWIGQLAMMPPLEGIDIGVWHNWATTGTPAAFRQQMDEVLRQIADRGGAVILGRAAAVVLADHPRAYHVRLTGPLDARVRQAARWLNISPEESRRRQVLVDRARQSYVRALYHREPNDPKLYHLLIDTTRLSVAQVVAVIALAARSAVGKR